MNGPPDLAVAHQAERVAVLYRRVVLLVGVQFLLICSGRAIVGAVAAGAPALVPLAEAGVVVIALGGGAWCGNTTYDLTREMGSTITALWMLGMLVPCVNLLALAALTLVTRSWCRKRGIRSAVLLRSAIR